jgi:2-dehydro-3-deoxy-D-arabinonate dehydratase
MRLAKLQFRDGACGLGRIESDHAACVRFGTGSGVQSLSEVLHAADPAGRAADVLRRADRVPLDQVTLLAPIDRQEVWAAGVTYLRSQAARREESKDAGSFYDKVYSAPRPELFFKATPGRVVGPGQAVRVRGDTQWCVPEPELALVVNPQATIVGLTIGDDVSCRDIEGENPLYLPQAKMFRACCALGPAITLAAAMPPRDQIGIQLDIVRSSVNVFSATSSIARMARSFEELVGWLFREQEFPDGVILLTGTGIVPPNEFTLQPGDEIAITIDGIGTLRTGTA